MIQSSYTHSDISYKEVFELIISTHTLSNVLEFGILNGYTLDILASKSSAHVVAYDIFDEFNGNHASQSIKTQFEHYDHVEIKYGDFFTKYTELEDQHYDLIHIDIANTGTTYQFAREHYFQKIKKGGIILLEGGSIERDSVYWMAKYNKLPIHPIVEEWKTNGLNCVTLGQLPSITIVQL